MRSLNRRRFLELGATSTAVALAGCSAGTKSSQSYGEWIPSSDEGILTAYIDFTLTERTSEIDPLLPLVLPSTEESEASELVPDLSFLDQLDDPLLRFPLQTGGQVAIVSSLSIAFAGLGDFFDVEQPTQGVTELFLVNDTVVGTGEIDVDTADEALRSGTRGAFGEIRFEVVSEDGGYTYYEPRGDLSGSVAINDSAVLVADTQADVRAAIDARNGVHSRATDKNETFSWLFDTAGEGDIVVGWVGPVQLEEFLWGNQDPSLPAEIVSTRDNVVSSVTFSPERGEITAEFALRRDGLRDARVNQLETQLGASSTDKSLSVDRDQISATGTYTDDVLDIDFVESRTTTPETPVPSGEDIPSQVAEAVPEDAFEFEHRESRNRVKVNFVEEFEADEVTVRAKRSESETSTTTPGPVTYLTVGVDPAGDEVVVIVTVDGESGIVARETVQ